MVQIIHKPTPLGKFAALFLGRDFWQTQLSDEGILVTRWLVKPVMIPWETVRCIDVSGLKPLYEGHTTKSRFCLLMIEDSKFVKRACTLSSERKTWFAAKNVLGLTNINEEAIETVHKEFLRIAQTRSIKLDGIWLPD